MGPGSRPYGRPSRPSSRYLGRGIRAAHLGNGGHPRPARRGARLHQALTELAEQDPLINVRIAGAEISLSLYGEVQKEVIEATLADDYGLRVAFRETTTICIERVVGTGEAVTAKDAEDNPFLAGVGLRIEPAPPGSGLAYARDGFVLGTMPPAFFAAVEETVHATLAQGLHGWQVTDCRVTLTHTGYFRGSRTRTPSSTSRCPAPVLTFGSSRRWW